MKRTTIAFLSILPLLVGGGCGLFEAKIVTACENVIKKRLRSPSGYRRVDITRSEKALDRADYYNYLYARESSSPLRDKLNKQFERGEVKPVTYTVHITYDAPNAFNAPIRGASVCEYTSEQGSDGGATDANVEVDGKTQLQWLTDQLAKVQ